MNEQIVSVPRKIRIAKLGTINDLAGIQGNLTWIPAR